MLCEFNLIGLSICLSFFVLLLFGVGMNDVYKIVTKKCPVCGREYFLQLVKRGEVVYHNDSVKMVDTCPFDGASLDLNIHEFRIGGEEFLIDVTKKCPTCKFEVDLYDIPISKHSIIKKDAKFEVERRCPICGGRLYVSHHLIVK